MGQHVNLTFYDTGGLLEVYTEGGEWDIINTREWRKDRIYDG